MCRENLPICEGGDFAAGARKLDGTPVGMEREEIRSFLAYGISRSIDQRSTLSAGHGL
jgi:hypothetical protein